MSVQSRDPSTPIKVAVLDANDLLREGMVVLLERTDGLTCCGEWRDGPTALRELHEASPDILILDMKLQGQSSFRVLEALPNIVPQTKAIAMVDCRAEDCVVLNPRRYGERDPIRVVPQPFAAPDDCLQMALKMGAQGVLHSHCSFTYLVKAIRSIHNGHYWMEIPTANRLAEQYLTTLHPTTTAPEGEVDRLTLRESQVAALVSQGRSNKEIARELHLGYSTVKNYVSSILEKLDLRDRTQIALFAMEQNGAG